MAIILFAVTPHICASIPDDATVIKVSGGEFHTLIVTNNHYTWGTGNNDFFQLGQGGTNTDPNKLPCRIHGIDNVGFLDGINDVAAGYEHSLALDVNGWVLAWGYNDKGQLGDGTREPSSTPVRVLAGEMQTESGYLEGITAISAGRTGTHSLALAFDGSCYGWGNNDKGQLGINESENIKLTPVKVLGGETGTYYLENVCGISAGVEHSLACDANANALAWGGGGYGKLGIGDTYMQTTPVIVHAGQQDMNNPQNSLKNIISVSAGHGHSMALEAYEPSIDPNCQGRVYCFGRNTNGQLGDNNQTDRYTPVIVRAGQQNPGNPTGTYLTAIIAISAGQEHSLALDVNGQVWSWGDDASGQLGNDTNYIDSLTPVRVNRFDGYPLGDIVSISAGYWHNIAIDVNGLAWVWGRNMSFSAGALGLGDQSNKPLAYPRPPVFNLTRDRFQFGIQPAIDDACNLDILEAQQGIYFESNVDFRNRSLTLQSTDPYNWDIIEKTIVQAEQGTSAVKFTVNVSPLIRGLTIQGAGYYGIECAAGSPRIDSCLLRDNAYNAIYGAADSNISITGCLIEDNGSGIYEDGGIFMYGSDSFLRLSNSLLKNNVGYGICASYSSLVEIKDSKISGNTKDGIYFKDYAYEPVVLIVERSIIANNTYRGIAVDDWYCRARVLNSMLYRNNGNGIEIGDTDVAPIIRNNTIALNNGTGVSINNPEGVTVNSCILWENGDDLAGCNAAYSWLTANGDPCFVKPDTNNFHLKPDSNCIDAGDPGFNDFNETDIDGEPRIADGDFNGIATVDMGADEFYWAPPDFNHDGIVNFIDFALFASAWQTGPGNPDYNDIYDLNDNNFIDYFDLAEFCDWWLWLAPWSDLYETLMSQPDNSMGMQSMAIAEQSVAVESAMLESTELSQSYDEQLVPFESPDIDRLLDWLDDAWLAGEITEALTEQEYLDFRQSLAESAE